jgi:hypothetical protein
VRCSELALELGEELVGTAPELVRWQPVVNPGPWGRDAVADAGVPTEAGTKAVLVRRAVPAGRAYLVCTNGARDPCCALKGAPVVRALGEAAVECTHVGGHRFAANVLVLPDNLLFGHLDAVSAQWLLDAFDEGVLLLEHLRGRCSLSAEQQAAEILVRRELDARGLDEVRHLEGTTFAFGDAVYDVRVRGERLPPRRVSCRDVKEESPIRWQLDTLTRASSGVG